MLTSKVILISHVVFDLLRMCCVWPLEDVLCLTSWGCVDWPLEDVLCLSLEDVFDLVLCCVFFISSCVVFDLLRMCCVWPLEDVLCLTSWGCVVFVSWGCVWPCFVLCFFLSPHVLCLPYCRASQGFLVRALTSQKCTNQTLTDFRSFGELSKTCGSNCMEWIGLP